SNPYWEDHAQSAPSQRVVWRPSGRSKKKAALLGGSISPRCRNQSSFEALRKASFTSPAALWAEPFALSSLPSVCSSLSPVTLPAASFIAPLALSAAPLTCSRSIYDSCGGIDVLTTCRLERPFH